MPNLSRYEKIEEASNFEIGPSSPGRNHRRGKELWSGMSCIFAFTSFVLAVLFVISTVTLRLRHQTEDGKTVFSADLSTFPNCGSSVAEAKSRGCKFDPMINGWTPLECYNGELSEEFMALPNYAWYYDADHEQPIPMEVLYDGELAITYPEPFHHDRHCLYTWRKLHLAAMQNTMVDSDTFWYNHSAHCTSYILGLVPLQPKVESHRTFLTCLPVGLNQDQ